MWFMVYTDKYECSFYLLIHWNMIVFFVIYDLLKVLICIYGLCLLMYMFMKKQSVDNDIHDHL